MNDNQRLRSLESINKQLEESNKKIEQSINSINDTLCQIEQCTAAVLTLIKKRKEKRK